MDVDTSGPRTSNVLHYVRIGGDGNGDAVVREHVTLPLPDGDIPATISCLAAVGSQYPNFGASAQPGRHDITPNGEIEIMADDADLAWLLIQLEPWWFPRGNPKPLAGLTFVHPPFLELSTNHAGGERFLSEIEYYADRWASFKCDLKAVKDSALADEIRKLALDNNFTHELRLRVPFSYNNIDPALGFAPWVLPDDHHVLRMVTHGGVHPRVASYLSVKI